MWSPSGYYMDHYSTGYEGYDYCEYDEGYAEEDFDDAGEAICTPTAPRCWNGSSCPFLASGTCQYYHPEEDVGEEGGAEDASEVLPEPKVAPVVAAVRPCARPWNVFIRSDEPRPEPAAKQTPEKAGEPRARLRSRSSRRKSLRSGSDSSSPQAKDDLARIKSRLAELRAKPEAASLKQRPTLTPSSTAIMKGA